ncbi:unnamed protein product [marine sediment metagenome]|uniref:Uncharacterized protein n=1 Tax=marine sediment metagenome TaxID=412755 RepID=X1BVV9_9ZZZZ
MEKTSKLITIIHTGEREYEGRKGQQYTVKFENGDSGQLEVWGDSKPPAEGETVSYELNETSFGTRIKLPRKSGGGGFGGAKKWTPQDVAQQDAIKLTCAAIEAGLDLKYYKQFFVECKSFMLHQEKEALTEKDLGMPDDKAAPVIQAEETDDMPF